jgi:hypothetical protein
MKFSAWIPFGSTIATTLTILVTNALVGMYMNTPLLVAVNAQLFTTCSDFQDNGVFYDLCFWNTPSPLTYIVDNGSSITFGTESYVITSCISNTARSLDTCNCTVLMNPSNPIAFTDFCNSCTIQVISETEFLPFFDCSNRLIGDCVGLDLAGFCIDNGDGTVPAPAPALVPAPVPAPVPALVPAPIPAPIGTVSPPSAPMTSIPSTNTTTTTTLAPRASPTISFPVTVPTFQPRPVPTIVPVVTDPTLFYNCINVEENGVVYESCIYNTSSPVTYNLTDGTSRSFGTDSYITIRCVANTARSTSTCSCEFLVDPSNPPVSSDSCQSCTIQTISGIEFWPYFDCSNRLTGECVGFDFIGYCIANDDNDGGGGGVPTSTSSSSSPIRAPPSAPSRPTRAPSSTRNTAPTRTFEGTDREFTSGSSRGGTILATTVFVSLYSWVALMSW